MRSEFRKFDADSSQLLDVMEFKQFMTHLHPDLKSFRWAECKRRFASYDTDNSGFLDFEEFVSLHEDIFGPLPADESDLHGTPMGSEGSGTGLGYVSLCLRATRWAVFVLFLLSCASGCAMPGWTRRN